MIPMKNFIELGLKKKFAAKLSITSNGLIILFKLIAGIVSGSISIISEAIHSMSDFLASVLTYFAVIRSSEPADKEHPFGHGRYEDVAGFIEGLLIILASFYIIFEASKKIFSGNHLEFNSTLGIVVMGVTIVANLIVSNYLFSIAKQTNSTALNADAQHLSTDVYSSLGVFTGLVLIKLTGITLLDPIIAIFVALIILKAGFSITKETLNNLVDGTLPESELKVVEDILNNCEEINGYKNIKSRKSGSNRDIYLTVLCDENMSLKKCHAICDTIEDKIKSSLPCTQVTTHCEPYKSGI